MAVRDLWSVTGLRLWAEFDLLDLLERLDDRAVIALLYTILPLPEAARLASYIVQGILPRAVRLRLDVVHCATNHGLNEFPTCALSLAVGRRGDRPDIPAPVHVLADELKDPLRIWVYAQVLAASGRQDPWPRNADGSARPFLVFEGLTAGAGWRKAFGTAEFVLFLNHWSVVLNQSSTLSSVWSPANPVTAGATAAIPGVLSPTGAPADSLATELVNSLGTPAVFGTDFWGYRRTNLVGGLKAHLRRLAEIDRFNWPILRARGTVCATRSNPAANADALAALARFEPFDSLQTAAGQAALQAGIAGWNGLNAAQRLQLLRADGYEYGVPLAVDAAAVSTLTAMRFAADVASQKIAELQSTSYWDVLVGSLAPNYAVAIVPMIDRCLVVPVTPGFRLPWKRIYATEYDGSDSYAVIPRPLRAVAFQHALFTAAGGETNPTVALPGGAGLAGSTLYDTCREGLILVRNAPRWLANVILPQVPAANLLQPEQTANSPAPRAQSGASSLAPADHGQLAQKYARALYLQEVLRHRQLRISGRLRFDICPGSTVAVQDSKEAFADDDAAQLRGRAPSAWRYGTVMRVSCLLNAESQKAGTTFQIGYVRDEAENADDTTSSSGHPFWRVPWKGAPLLADATFGTPDV